MLHEITFHHHREQIQPNLKDNNMRSILCILLASLISVSSLAASPQDRDQFGVKALFLDCRSQVITTEALYKLADNMAANGLNALVVEWEATFPFEEHATLSNEYSYSKKEVTDFIAYCSQKGIDVIPLQNCFGHAEYILRHNRYHTLREDHSKEVSMVCPLKHELAVPVFEEIFAEVAALHPSQYFHIGADETYILGSCPECKKIADSEGKSRLFVDYVNHMVDIVLKMGKTPMIWADIILKYPEAVDQLSKELIFVDWNYGWNVNNFGDLDRLFKAGVKMWGASAMRSGPDNIYLTQWMKHFNNLRDFIPHARKSGYQGMINTSWSVSGQYGFHYDNSWEVVSMQPIRQVYPAQALNILVEAYGKAVGSNKVIDPESFILEYAQRRFDIDKEGVEKFLRYMKLPQETIGRDGKDEKGKKVSDVVKETSQVLDEFKSIKPKSNRWEYDHLLLMMEIRLNYLKYKEIEAIYDNSEFRATSLKSTIPTLAKEMKTIYEESVALQKRYRKLNKGFLKDGQWQLLEDVANEKMKALYLRLTNYAKQLN